MTKTHINNHHVGDSCGNYSYLASFQLQLCSSGLEYFLEHICAILFRCMLLKGVLILSRMTRLPQEKLFHAAAKSLHM